MYAKDIMTSPVLSVSPESPILEAIRIMLQRRISGLPVIDKDEHLVGMLTEGDLLRRAETETQRRRPRWLEFLVGPGRLAEEYSHSHGRKVQEFMSGDIGGHPPRRNRAPDGEKTDQADSGRSCGQSYWYCQSRQSHSRAGGCCPQYEARGKKRSGNSREIARRARTAIMGTLGAYECHCEGRDCRAVGRCYR